MIRSRILDVARQLGIHPAYLLPQLGDAAPPTSLRLLASGGGVDSTSSAPPAPQPNSADAPPTTSDQPQGSLTGPDVWDIPTNRERFSQSQIEAQRKSVEARISAFADETSESDTEVLQFTYRRPTGEIQTLRVGSGEKGRVAAEKVRDYLNFIPPGAVILDISHNHPAGTILPSLGENEQGKLHGDVIWLRDTLPRLVTDYGLTVDPNVTFTIVARQRKEPSEAFSYHLGRGDSSIVWSRRRDGGASR